MDARPEDFVAPAERSIVDAAIYRDGHRIATPGTIADVAKQLHKLNYYFYIGKLRNVFAKLRYGFVKVLFAHKVKRIITLAHHLAHKKAEIDTPALVARHLAGINQSHQLSETWFVP